MPFYFVATRSGSRERNLDATCTNLRLPATTRIQFGGTWPARSIYGYPMQLGHRCESLVTSSITIFDPSIFRGVESFYYVSSSREAFRFRVVKGATRSTKEPCQKWLEEGLKPVTFKTVEGKGEFLWEKVSFKFSWWKKKLWSGTASWIFQWMIKRREFLWWKIWRITSLSFVLLFSRYDEISS